MSKGVILLCLKHPYYGTMGYNLALSLRHHDKPINIAVMTSGGGLSHLFDWQRKIFSSVVELDLEKCRRNGNVEVLMSKYLLYDLSPYDQTIFLDADTICSPQKNFTELFKELKGKDIVIANRGEITQGNGMSEWVKKDALFSHYNLTKFYDLSSEFIYFEKTKRAKKVFEDARNYYLDDSVATLPFADGKPDEVGFGLSLEKNNVTLSSPFLPSYWQPYYTSTERKIYNSEYIKKNFYFISAGGKNVEPNIAKVFFEITKYYYYHSKVNLSPLQLQPKAKLIPERKSI